VGYQIDHVIDTQRTQALKVWLELCFPERKK
jgi:hypothetical protein